MCTWTRRRTGNNGGKKVHIFQLFVGNGLKQNQPIVFKNNILKIITVDEVRPTVFETRIPARGSVRRNVCCLKSPKSDIFSRAFTSENERVTHVSDCAPGVCDDI